MASFESSASPKIVSEEDEMPKQPLKRLEHAIHMFTKVAIPTDLDRLAQHRGNIEKYQRLQEWEKLNVELINASRTVQQLKANVREMEKTRNQIRDEDLDKFDARVLPIKEEAISAVMSFIDLHGSDDEPLSHRTMTDNVQTVDGRNAVGEMDSDESESHPAQPWQQERQRELQQQEQMMVVQEAEAKESWHTLRGNLVELNSMIHDFSTMVHDQQEKVDSIVDNVDSAHGNVQQGVLNLGGAAKYKAMIIPVAGAVIGGAVGGPVGLLAGAKLGMAAAVGGGLVGFTGGKLIKSRQDKINEIELQNLSSTQRQWKSTPELNFEGGSQDS
ncbi:syntaxin-17-like [Ptychodera flava]|uniref:syntaxin-17-like n=1 Tax=Ptychodera flava TaxID=63121 RepID=UPI003969D19A